MSKVALGLVSYNPESSKSLKVSSDTTAVSGSNTEVIISYPHSDWWRWSDFNDGASKAEGYKFTPSHEAHPKWDWTNLVDFYPIKLG